MGLVLPAGTCNGNHSRTGIGYAITHRLVEDGIDVAINDMSSKKTQIFAAVEELRKKGRRALAVPGDVTFEVDVIAMTEKTVNELGSVDIVKGTLTAAPLSQSYHGWSQMQE